MCGGVYLRINEASREKLTSTLVQIQDLPSPETKLDPDASETEGRHDHAPPDLGMKGPLADTSVSTMAPMKETTGFIQASDQVLSSCALVAPNPGSPDEGKLAPGS
ncbi:unnamed protein product [Phytophthora lilii]|uniref:Unnamed protein product n=1 Tax=Phytophthora lilii TaxID=2077276 RepID=A0A9W6TWV4_9STRA|nr:unnamed protein product [Phytophthora lilii]